MSKFAKTGFIIFNIIYFFVDYIVIPYLPNPILFGWMPLQLFAMFAMPLLAAVVWGTYFNAFFKTQKHVDYKDM